MANGDESIRRARSYATLRSMCVALRDTIFEAELAFNQPPSDDEWMLLVASALGLRAAGTGRNRGRGWLQATLNDDDACAATGAGEGGGMTYARLLLHD